MATTELLGLMMRSVGFDCDLPQTIPFGGRMPWGVHPNRRTCWGIEHDRCMLSRTLGLRPKIPPWPVLPLVLIVLLDHQ